MTPAPCPVKIIHKQESIPVGCVPRMSAQGGVCPEVYQGCLPRGVYVQRCLPRGKRGLPRGLSAQGGVSAWGCLPGGYLPRGVCVCQGCLSREGVSARGCLPRGCLPWGCLPRGVSAPVHAGIHTSPVDRMTDACENITLSQLHCGW